MKKYKVIIGTNYITGYLRYGHGEAVVEANSPEEAKKIALENKDFELFIDDYSVEDYEYNHDDIEVEGVE